MKTAGTSSSGHPAREQARIRAFTRENAELRGRAEGSLCNQKITGDANSNPTIRLFALLYSLRQVFRRGFIRAASICPRFFRDSMFIAIID
jgi:hypothetical protein